MIISLLPRLILPKETTPSISLTTAGLEGLRASKSSVTRGRPPVISPALEDLRGIFTKILPMAILSLSSIIKCAPTGRLYERMTPPFPSSIWSVGINFLFLDSEITFSWNPVCSSIST